jgi:hypothetical protein
MKAQELDIPQHEGVVGVAPEKKTEEVAASGAMHDVPGAELAIGGGLKSSGQSRGGPTESTTASTSTAEQVLVGLSFTFAIQAILAAKGSDTGGGGTIGADVMKTHELGSPQLESVVGVAPEEEAEDVEDDTARGATYRKASGTSQSAAVKRTAAGD